MFSKTTIIIVRDRYRSPVILLIFQGYNQSAFKLKSFTDALFRVIMVDIQIIQITSYMMKLVQRN